VYIHPQQHFGGRRYDPALDRQHPGPPRSARLTPAVNWSPAELGGVVGRGSDSQMHARKTEIASIDSAGVAAVAHHAFRDSNVETVQLVNPPWNSTACWPTKAGNVVGTLVELRVRERPRAVAG